MTTRDLFFTLLSKIVITKPNGDKLSPVEVDQIMKLLFEICKENPITIDKAKIIKPIKLINLAWVIAICRKKYNSFSEIIFEDTKN